MTAAARISCPPSYARQARDFVAQSLGSRSSIATSRRWVDDEDHASGVGIRLRPASNFPSACSPLFTHVPTTPAECSGLLTPISLVRRRAGCGVRRFPYVRD